MKSDEELEIKRIEKIRKKEEKKKLKPKTELEKLECLIH